MGIYLSVNSSKWLLHATRKLQERYNVYIFRFVFVLCIAILVIFESDDTDKIQDSVLIDIITIRICAALHNSVSSMTKLLVMHSFIV